MRALALLTLLVPTLSLAAEQGEIEVGAFGGAVVTDDLEFMGSGATFGLRAAYAVRDGASIEVDLPVLLGKVRRTELSYLGLTPRVYFRGTLLPDFEVQPVITLGAGIFYKGVNDPEVQLGPAFPNPDVDLLLVSGAGAQVALGDVLLLRSDLKFLLNLGTESIDRHGDTFLNWEWTAGVAVKFGGKKDTDKDSIPDEEDQCITEAEDLDGFDDLDGCPDPDNDDDGILDGADQCPLAAEDKDGFEDDDGCPDDDNDEDGIADARDSCPDEKGSAEARGCPDGDADGVADKDDVCPDVAGLRGFKGCPDTDEDGLADPDDVCPTDRGTRKARGCPDGDDDGVADKDDACVEEAGPAEAVPAFSTGCPVDIYVTRERIVLGKDNLKVSTTGFVDRGSKKKLDTVADLLSKHEAIQVEVLVNLDVRSNLPAVAQKRADGIVAHLVAKGISADRLTTKVGENAVTAEFLVDLLVKLPEEAPPPQEDTGEGDEAPAEGGDTKPADKKPGDQ